MNFGLPDIQFTHEKSGLPAISIYSSRFRFTFNFCLLENSVYLQFLFTTKQRRVTFEHGKLELISAALLICGRVTYRKYEFQFTFSVTWFSVSKFQFTHNFSLPYEIFGLPQFREIYLCKFRLTCNFSLLFYHLFAHENFGLPVIPIKLKFAGKPKICRVISNKFQFTNVKSKKSRFARSNFPFTRWGKLKFPPSCGGNVDSR